MPSKKRPEVTRFPLVFHNGLRDEAQRIADELHRGNLTAYINYLIRTDVTKATKRKKP